MIRILYERIIDGDTKYIEAAGLSTDSKPTSGIITGSKFFEVDTGAGKCFDEVGAEWHDDPETSGLGELKSEIEAITPVVETVSGATPSINAADNHRYICGEVSTLAITVPASGIFDVVFTSSSTATVLTITPPSGVTAVKWANGFDPTSLDANTIYEINIMDGEYGVAAAWT